MSGPVLGNDSRFTLATMPIANVKDENFGLKTAVENITTKDSVGWEEVLPTVHGGEITLELNYEKKPGSPTKQYPVDLLNYQLNRTKVAFTMPFSDETGDVKLTGNVYITGFDVKTKNDVVSTISVSVKPTGTITVGTV